MNANERFKLTTLILLGLVLIIMISTTVSTSGENKRLKSEIKENLEAIEKLESEKFTILELIKEDSLAIVAKDKLILELSNKGDSLKNNLKHLKDEKTKNFTKYLSGSVGQRVDAFAELARERDSTH